ncbi:MAG: hypothetical protein NTV45_03725 [Firmicutes bacterium]|nr:hypothetical protein [Bacillota bacterium]
MQKIHKKESWLVICIVVAAVLILGMISYSHADIIVEPPTSQTVLEDNDLAVNTPAGRIVVGISTREEVKKIYPLGDDLGRSGIYHPKGIDCLLTFSAEDILIRMDIGPGNLSSARGVTPGDSFTKVVDIYGNNYTRAYDKMSPQNFDAYFGADKYILFKVEDNVVKKFYIGSGQF